MKNCFSQKIDSDLIRQGLLSIRNTQLQLLNQLKYETEILKNYSPPSTNSDLSDKTNLEYKREAFPYLLQQRVKDRDILLKNEEKKQSGNQLLLEVQKQLKEELNYFKNQNKLLNINLTRARQNLQLERDKLENLSANFRNVIKIYNDILVQTLQNTDLNKIKAYINQKSQILTHESNQYKTLFDDILIILSDKIRKNNQQSRIKIQIQNQKDIANQIIELKSQIMLLINQSSNHPTQKELTNFKITIEEKNKILLEKDATIKRLQNQNKELSVCWQRQLNQRKKMMSQWQKLKKQGQIWEQKQKKIIFYAKDMQNRAQKAQKNLIQRQKAENILKDNNNKLTQTIKIIRQNNQSLRSEIKMVEQNQQNKIQCLLQQKIQLSEDIKNLRIQKQKLLQNKEAQLLSLRNHLTEIKKNQDALRDMERKNKDNDIIHQQLYWKKVNIIRTNSTIDHLWQVKQVEYQNIHELLAKIKRK